MKHPGFGRGKLNYHVHNLALNRSYFFERKGEIFISAELSKDRRKLSLENKDQKALNNCN